MVAVVKDEEEHQVVTSALDITAEILKQCGAAATRDQGNIDKVLSCVKRIMKGECACQDVEVEDGDEEEAEQDEILFGRVHPQPRQGDDARLTSWVCCRCC